MQRCGERALGCIDEINATEQAASAGFPPPSSIPRGAPIFVRGWIHVPQAADPPEVVITVDGAFGAVAAGRLRPDVAELHGPSALHAGFECVLPSGSIAEGVRTIAAVRLVDAMTYQAGPERQITIAASALSLEITTPFVAGIDIRVDDLLENGEAPASAGIPSFGRWSTVNVVGWAADLARGEPVTAVYALVDDLHLFRGRYGGARPDVAAELGRPHLHSAGFDVRIDAGALPIGDHLIRVVALSADGQGRSESGLLPFAIRPD